MPSTVIREFRYHEERRELEIIFTTGRRYLYHGVSKDAAERFRAAFSKGRHFNVHIRDNYRFTELAGAY